MVFGSTFLFVVSRSAFAIRIPKLKSSFFLQALGLVPQLIHFLEIGLPG